MPLGSRPAEVRLDRAASLCSGSSSSSDIPQIESDSPGGVGVGRQKVESRSSLSAARTLKSVSKVRINLDTDTDYRLWGRFFAGLTSKPGVYARIEVVSWRVA